MTKQDVERAFQAAHWGNTTHTSEQWWTILNDSDPEPRFQIFEKLFREDSRGEDLKALFDRAEISQHLARLTRPYHFRHQERRRLVWRSNYLGIAAKVPELDWVSSPRDRS